MENNTSFDLTSAIRRWRENLAQSPNFRSENLDELESHLQDCVRDLSARGLSEEEALTIAAGRIGPAPDLATEFARINGAAVWIDRGLWMLSGWAAVSTIQSFLFSLSLVPLLPGNPAALLLVLMWASPVIVAAFVMRSLARAAIPAYLAAGFFLVGLLPLVVQALTSSYMTGRWLGLFSTMVLAPYTINGRVLALSATRSTGSLLEWGVVSLVVLVLAKKRPRPAHS